MSKISQLQIQLKEVKAIKEYCDKFIKDENTTPVQKTKNISPYESLQSEILNGLFTVNEDFENLKNYKSIKTKDANLIRLKNKIYFSLSSLKEKLNNLKKQFDQQKLRITKNKKNRWTETELENNSKRLLLMAKEISNYSEEFEKFKTSNKKKDIKGVEEMRKENLNIVNVGVRTLTEKEKNFLYESSLMDDKIDKKLENIKSGLSGLKIISKEIGKELKEQQEIIERLLDRTTILEGEIDNENKRVFEILENFGGFGKLFAYITLMSLIGLTWVFILTHLK